jgi:hypothetical protein
MDLWRVRSGVGRAINALVADRIDAMAMVDGRRVNVQ